jgi:predicted kinase
MEDMRNEESSLEKTLVIVRGCPGSGKSSFARFIWDDYIICEADKYFIDSVTGEYKFDPAKIRDAHEWCRSTVEMYMHDSTLNNQFYRTIVVSNTSTQEWEMEPYFDLAKTYGYKVFSIIVENRHGGKNIHECPEEKVEGMRKRFEIKL